MMFKLENLIGVPSIINFKGIILNHVKECDIKKLPHKTPRIKIITAILRLTSKRIKKPKKPQEKTKNQLLENLPSANVNMQTIVEKSTPKIHKRIATQLPRVAKIYNSLHDYEDQDFDSEVQEIIEILRNALANMNSGGETRALHSAVGVFIKSGFQTFKEHRKHIESMMLHINAQKLLTKELVVMNVIRISINRLNEINAIYRLNKKEMKAGSKQNVIISR